MLYQRKHLNFLFISLFLSLIFSYHLLLHLRSLELIILYQHFRGNVSSLLPDIWDGGKKNKKSGLVDMIFHMGK